MLFGRRKPGYTTTVDGSVDPEQAVLELQKAELAAKKKPKAEVFDIDAASETARRLKETGSTFDGSAAKTGEDVIAAVERETAELAAKQAAEAAPEAAEAAQPDAAKPELLDFLAGEPEAENDPFADQPTKTAPELPELTPAQELAGYIRARSAAALITPPRFAAGGSGKRRRAAGADARRPPVHRYRHPRGCKGHLLLFQRQHER